MTNWNPRANELFLKALELSSPLERQAYLEKACGGDEVLRAEVEALLAASAQAGSFLESPVAASPASNGIERPPVGGGATIDGPPITEGPGALIGQYKLLEQIGEGGFGVVFMAEQTQPVRRKVALKILKPGMDTRQVVARFEAERQALAIMDHPNIAKVFDGGATATGRPYFVMELVRGVPITEFCDQNHLTPRQRLELFVPVCQAVQHAHQKGIIHRDLKPSNILVTMQDAAPLVKVIDFGVAKALGHELTEKTLFTGFTQMIGTPLYMSPEQAGQGGLDIDTRSDIYSLGVLLYELLTGTTPISKERFKKAAYDEIRRIIREEEPPKPSTRLSESKDALPSISARRHTEPTKLTKLVRGELDWIVMKCLDKDRNRRYETANGLAMDMQRYLNDEHVQACPPSRWYRFRKFARRNKRVLIGTGLIAAALVVATVALAISNVRVREERDEKELALKEKAAALTAAEANFRKARAAVDRSFTLVSESDLFDAAGLQPLRKQLLEAALQYYREFVEQEPDDPKLQAELAAAYFRLWQIYQSVDRNRDSIAALGKALDLAEKLRREHPGNSEIPRALSATRYGWFRFGVGSLHVVFAFDPADIQALERASALWAALAAENPRIPDFQRNLAEVYDAIASYERALGHRPEAMRAAQKAFDIWDRLAQEHPALVAGGRERQYARALLAVYLREADRPEEALKIFQETIDFLEREAKQQPKERRHRIRLAWLYRRVGESFSVYGWRPKEAEETWRRAISLYEDLAVELPGVASHLWYLGTCYRDLGRVLWRTGRPLEAEKVYLKELKVFEKVATDFPDSSPYWEHVSRSRLNLAQVCSQSGRLDEADTHYRFALEAAQRALAVIPDDPDQAPAFKQYAAFLIECPDAKLRNPARALELATKATELEPKRSEAWLIRGRVQVALERWDSAVADFSKGIEVAPPGDGAVAWCYGERASAYRALKQLDKALADLTKATELWPKMYDVWAWRAWFYRDQEQWDKAAADFSRAIELNPTYWILFDRAIAHIKLKKPDKAVADLREAVKQGLPEPEARFKTDPSLESLRTRGDFKALQLELEKKAK